MAILALLSAVFAARSAPADTDPNHYHGAYGGFRGIFHRLEIGPAYIRLPVANDTVSLGPSHNPGAYAAYFFGLSPWQHTTTGLCFSMVTGPTGHDDDLSFMSLIGPFVYRYTDLTYSFNYGVGFGIADLSAKLPSGTDAGYMDSRHMGTGYWGAIGYDFAFPGNDGGRAEAGRLGIALRFNYSRMSKTFHDGRKQSVDPMWIVLTLASTSL